MKLTKSKLKQLIKEELRKTLNEARPAGIAATQQAIGDMSDVAMRSTMERTDYRLNQLERMVHKLRAKIKALEEPYGSGKETSAVMDPW